MEIGILYLPATISVFLITRDIGLMQTDRNRNSIFKVRIKTIIILLNPNDKINECFYNNLY